VLPGLGQRLRRVLADPPRGDRDRLSMACKPDAPAGLAGRSRQVASDGGPRN
jgi:hypothetical protein